MYLPVPKLILLLIVSQSIQALNLIRITMCISMPYPIEFRILIPPSPLYRLLIVVPPILVFLISNLDNIPILAFSLALNGSTKPVRHSFCVNDDIIFCIISTSNRTNPLRISYLPKSLIPLVLYLYYDHPLNQDFLEPS